MAQNPQVAGFILAGGESTRMGRSKAALELRGVPMLVRMARLVESVAGAPTVIGNLNGADSFGLATIADEWPGAGPLGAIATALGASVAPWNLIVACDLPYLTNEWLEFLVRRALDSQADAVVPANTRGAEPLCAMYNKRAEAAIRAALERGVRKVTDGLADTLVELIDPFEWKAFDSEGSLFKNMNSPEDYEEARRRFEGGGETGLGSGRQDQAS
ncbi:MAG: molybdenum cofactor guanylyltransferase [Acidobacteriota bacterium]|nr:molybdenum cofactor guanylyltransferase [Acidobacteriota bacterium]MDE3169081.1 molybdenum cofactor guanylyltransferase [Acidobacteriota bacterium]